MLVLSEHSAKYLFFRDPELMRRIGAATALEVRATGIPYAFAPCIAVGDTIRFLIYLVTISGILFTSYCKLSSFSLNLCGQVCRDPRWGRCYESYSEDPKIVQEMTDIIIGLQGEIPYESRKGIPYVAGKYGNFEGNAISIVLYAAL